MQVEKLLAEISAMEEGGARPGSARTGSAKSGGAAADLDARVRMFERLASEGRAPQLLRRPRQGAFLFASARRLP